MMKKKIIISGGGTGVYSRRLHCRCLKAALEHVEILLLVQKVRWKMERVPKAGYSIIGLPVAGLQKINIKNLLSHLSFK